MPCHLRATHVVRPSGGPGCAPSSEVQEPAIVVGRSLLWTLRIWKSILFPQFRLPKGSSCMLWLLMFSRSVGSDFLWPHGLQHARLPCSLLSPGVCWNSCPFSQWCYLTISSSAAHFCSFQSSPGLRSFPMSQLFASGGQSVGTSASGSVLPVNIWSWFPLGLTGLISQESSPAPQFESINSSSLSLLYGPTLVSLHDYWKNLWLLIPVSSGSSFCCFCLPTAM